MKESIFFFTEIYINIICKYKLTHIMTEEWYWDKTDLQTYYFEDVRFRFIFVAYVYSFKNSLIGSRN